MNRPFRSAMAPAGLRPRGADAARRRLGGVTLAALGVVFGSIGTSPLYAVDEIFAVGVARTPENIIGGISLIVWTLTVVIAVEYAGLILKAQNDGEGGVFALYGLLHDGRRFSARLLLWALMLGAGLLLGDGMLSPAISVLSAVEGLAVAMPAAASFIVPVTVGLLVLLFSIQFLGTAGIGGVFGPVIGLWFAVIAVLGAHEIILHPAILAAFNPLYGLHFLSHIGWHDALLLLGALMLVVTGGEALYADVGHFGIVPIRISWFALVFPALMLNYLGQGAYLLSGAPIAGGKLFFSLVPGDYVLPVVVLATCAATIASQALISGVFSLSLQAIRLGLFPRIAILHTHQAHAGQIYVPFVNWALLTGAIILVMVFGSSRGLAAAYGLAVAGVMLITAIAMYFVARHIWKWSLTATNLVWGGLSAVNGAFLAASSLKFHEGGFVPVVVGLAVFTVMGTWRWGRKATFAAYSAKASMTIEELVALHRASPNFMERNAVIMAAKPLRSMSDRAPALIHMLWERCGLLPRNLIFVEVTHRKVPYIKDDRYRVIVFDRDRDRGSIIGVELSFGFMEEPNVERLLEDLARHDEIDLPTDRRSWIVHVAHENLLPSRTMNFLKRLRFALFVFLRQISRPGYLYYGLGDQLHLSAEIIPVRVR
ncbi:MAG: KUP/HAK/KT family potassium transporter [Ancalomicrobiaceae bacterium]|nr:KUP/HAK/KT family potassium transporter [Ancalomicrobiaceae bacterium]